MNIFLSLPNELLDAILCQVDFKDMLKLKRVRTEFSIGELHFTRPDFFVGLYGVE
jgi:hypothetical protein